MAEIVQLNPNMDKLSTSIYSNNDPDFYPWLTEGYKVIGGKFPDEEFHEEGYGTLWDLKGFRQINLGQWVADFYLLDGVASCVLVPGSASPQTTVNARALLDMLDAGFYMRNHDNAVESCAFEASIQFARNVVKQAPLVRNYLHYACASELSYHAVGYPLGHGDWSDVTASWWYLTQRFGHGKCAEWATACFDMGGWNPGYGGEAWANISRTALQYELNDFHGQPFGDREFLDRAFSLQHNGGTVFNKVSWQEALDHNLHVLLDAHANSLWYKLYDAASSATRTITDNYLKACNVDKDKTLGRPEVYKTVESKTNTTLTTEGIATGPIETPTDNDNIIFTVGDIIEAGTYLTQFKLVNINGSKLEYEYYAKNPITPAPHNGDGGFTFTKKDVIDYLASSKCWNFLKEGGGGQEWFKVGTKWTAPEMSKGFCWEITEIVEHDTGSGKYSYTYPGIFGDKKKENWAIWTDSTINSYFANGEWFIVSQPEPPADVCIGDVIEHTGEGLPHPGVFPITITGFNDKNITVETASGKHDHSWTIQNAKTYIKQGQWTIVDKSVQN